MNSGPAGGFDISSLTRQMPAIPSGHQPVASGHPLHHPAAAYAGHQPQHQQLHQSHHPHHHLQQQSVHPHHALLLPNIGPIGLAPVGLHPHHPAHHQTVPLQTMHHSVPHHLQTSDTMHHFSQQPHHSLHHQTQVLQHQQQHHQPLPHPVNPHLHHPQAQQQQQQAQPHLSHAAQVHVTGHSPQSLPSPHPAVPVPVTRPVSDETNALASSVNLSSVQSLVDVLVELPLPSEAPEAVSASCRLIAPEIQAHNSPNTWSPEQQHNLGRSLCSALQIAKQQLSQLNLSFKQKKSNSDLKANNGSGDANNVTFSRNHRDNSYLLSVLRQLDALSSDAAIPSVAPEGQVRSQNQYWSPWSGSDAAAQAVTPAPVPATSQSPYKSSPSYPTRASAVSQTPVYNDNSNSSSSFSAEAVTPSAMATTPTHQFQQQQQQYCYQQLQPPQSIVQQSVAVAVDKADLSQQQQQPQQQNQVEANALYYQQAEPVILLERSDLMEKALQDYYANGSNGADAASCPPSLADRIKSNKRQRSNSSHSKSEKREQKSKQREQPESSPSPPVTKKSKTSSNATKSSSSNHFISSDEPQLSINTLSSSLPPTEKFEAMLDELFDVESSVSSKKKKKKKRSSSSSEESGASDDESRQAKTNGDSSSRLPALFDITINSNTLIQLVSVTAKLKRSNQMQSAPISKISNLLTVLTQQLTVQSAGLKKRKSVEDSAAGSDEEDEDANITTSASMMHKFESCCDTCLVALYILSSNGMPSRVYLEECIEQIISFLNTTIQQFTTIGASASSPSKSKSKSPKKTNSYISPTIGANKKILAKMYTKWSELIGLIVELLSHRPASLTDTLVLSSTRLALGAFFLENLNSNSAASSFSSNPCQSNEVQLNALNLTTVIFSQYPGHRGVILEELLQSIARLPTSKRGRVVYKVDGDDGSASISMFSALLLQLIQSLFVKNGKKAENSEGEKRNRTDDKSLKSTAQSLKQQYEASLKVAFTFLNSFLRKCCGLSVGGHTVSSDGDYRVLFEALVFDLMVTLHKPNWPAAQLLTQVLVKILITNINNSVSKGKSTAGSAQAQLNLRLASLDHLGTICSRFAKELSDVDGVKSEVKTSLNSILTGENENTKKKTADNEMSGEEGSDSEQQAKKKKKKRRKSSRNILDFLQSDERMLKEIWKHLVRYCDEEKMIEQKNLLASIWLKEMEREMESQSSNRDEEGESNGVVSLSNQEQLEAKVKAFMHLYATAANPNLEDDEYHVIDSKTSGLIIRYLDISQSTTVKLFDSALGHIIAALSGTSNTIMRSRSMKSLSCILNHAKKESATALLARSDLQRAMKAALLDPSTSVREATIDLIGKFILSAQSEELIDKYFDIITDRVLDTGVSVRKRVIKILRDICLTYPSYKKVPDICAKIIKRVNDDGEGIRKLVTETFTSMWFKEERDRESIRLKVASINHVVATVLTDRIGTEWLQQLLQNLFTVPTDPNKKKTELADDDEDAKPAPTVQQLQQVTNASSQIIDVLIGEVLCGDSSKENAAQRKSDILSAVTTIWLFSKVAPSLLLNHISTLHPFLSTRCTTQMDIMILSKVVHIIELVLPKLSNPSETMLTKIEEDLTKNILQNNAAIVSPCVSCLSAVIHKHTGNQALAQDLFKRFFQVLDSYTNSSASNPNYLSQPGVRPRLLRALFTCGLFAKHFSSLHQKESLYRILIRFVKDNVATPESHQALDSDVLLKALTGLGFMFERNPQFSLMTDTVEIYCSMLKCSIGSEEYRESVQCQVLKNLTNYLSDEFNSEMSITVNWSKENLKSMSSEDGDSSSLQSSIIQRYLADVLSCTLSPIVNVRRAAVNVIHIIHNGGHVHPLQLVPYLIAMSSDDDSNIRFRADHVLNEIERKYHGYVSMKSKSGVQLSYQLHSHSGRRGYRIENVIQSAPQSNTTPPASSASETEEKLVTGRLATLYAVVANNRQSRRAFVSGLLKYFDMIGDTSASGFNDMMANTSDLSEEDQTRLQQFVCDNIVWLQYSLWDEPLYILTQLDLNLSILASNVQSQFKDILNLTDDDEDALDAKDDARKEDADAQLSAAMHNRVEGEEEQYPSDQSTDQSAAATNLSFISDLKSYIPKPMISMLSLVELVKVLRAYYMLFWCKYLIRELYGIHDLKIQDYSPNENQKVWDKPVHRRVIDVRAVDRLMTYPQICIEVEKMNENIREHILNEYQRFKDVQVTGVDRQSKSVAQILREPTDSKKDFSQMREHYEPVLDPQPAIPQDMQEELMRRIRAQENHVSVSLETISDKDMRILMQDPAQQKNPGQMNDHQSLKIRIPKNSYNDSESKKKKKKKEKKRKKKKHHRRNDSDSEEESFSDSDEESDDDPDYS